MEAEVLMECQRLFKYLIEILMYEKRDIKDGPGFTRFGGGGGAGFGNLTGDSDDGDGGVHSRNPDKPRGAKNFLTQGTGKNARGVGGYIQFQPRNRLVKIPIENNGGFGGGGYGSAEGLKLSIQGKTIRIATVTTLIKFLISFIRR